MDLPRFDPRKINVAFGAQDKPAPSTLDYMLSGLAANWRMGGLPAVLGVPPRSTTVRQLNGIDRVIDLGKLARTPFKGLK